MQQEVQDKRTVRPYIGRGTPQLSRRVVGEHIMRHALAFAFAMLAAYGTLFFGVRPFGVAFAASAVTYLPAAVAGVIVVALITRDMVSLAALALMLFSRMVCYYAFEERDKHKLFAERPAWRAVAAAVGLLAVGVFSVVRGGFRYYDLFGVLLAVAAAPLTAFLYSGLFESREQGGIYDLRFEAGVGALLLTAVLALREVNLFGVYPAAAIAAFAAFYLVAHRGVAYGMIGGALAGLCFDFRMAPAFVCCALCFALLERSSRGGGILCGSAAAAAWGFLLHGVGGLTELLPALLLAGAVFLATDSAGLIEEAPTRRAAVSRKRAAALAAKAGEQAANEARLREISGAFLDLSGKFFELSSRTRRPGLLDLRHLCDQVFDGTCPHCPKRDVCWGSEYASTAATVTALGDRLHAKGRVDTSAVPPAWLSRCAEMPRILEAINKGALQLTEEMLRGDKTAVVAMDYAAAGRMIGEILESGRASFACDSAMGERICERLSRMGYTVESVAVCGTTQDMGQGGESAIGQTMGRRRVLLRGVQLPFRHIKVRELRALLEKYCHFRLGDPQVTQSDGVTDMVFPEKVTLATATVRLTRPKTEKGRQIEGRRCGDSVTTLQSEEGLDYALLCDGMGSGNAAALTSALATAFLTRLLQAGNRADTSLKMLNGFLAARGRKETEASTTVDLLEIDRVSGEASLFKCGAAPTFLLRGGEVTRFFSRTAPVGILEALDAERIRFAVQAGDVVVQVSDGVTRGEEDCPWLCDLLATTWDGNAEDFARRVLGRATKEGEDDLSVLVTVVNRAAS